MFEMMLLASDNHAKDAHCHDFIHLRGARVSFQDKLTDMPTS